MLKATGYSVQKIKNESRISDKSIVSNPILPATCERPIGDIYLFLEDILHRGFECKMILDIGANNGDWSRMASKIFPDSEYFLIDPLIEMENDLKSFCREHKKSSYRICGVGSKNEMRYLTIWNNNLEGSTFTVNENATFKKNNLQRLIQIRTINYLLEKKLLKIPQIIKIDVQGFEIEVLKGCSLLFGKTDLFIIEISLFKFNKEIPTFFEVIEFMEKIEYVLYDIVGYGRRPYDGALAQLDICFVKKSSFLKSSNLWNTPSKDN